MKKLLAIAVIFALVTGAAFAEWSVSGVVETRAAVGNAWIAGSEEVSFRGDLDVARLVISGANDEGTLSGTIRYDNWNVGIYTGQGGNNLPTDHTHTASWEQIPRLYMAFVWWRPSDMFGVFMGKQSDGIFETAKIVAHNFSGGGQVGSTIESYNYHGSAWGPAFSTGWCGLALEITPIDGLAIRLGTGGINNSGNIPIADWFQSNLYTQAVYDADFGTISLVYAMGANKSGNFAVSFHSASIVDSLAFEVSFAYRLKGDGALSQDPMWFGFGVAYDMDDFKIKARARMAMGGEGANDGRLYIQGDLLPSYNLGDFEVRCLIRGQFEKANSNVDGDFGLAINPYMVMPLGGGKFTAGIMYQNDKFAGGAFVNGRWFINAGLSLSL